MAILTLALGIGMNTAVFSVVNAVLLRPLPYPDAHRLVWVANRIDRLHLEAVGEPDFLDWKEQARSFDRLASYSYGGMTRRSPLQITERQLSWAPRHGFGQNLTTP